MAELPPLPDIFGNYTLRGITEVVAPDAVSWLPTAPGWRYLGALLALWLFWRCWGYWKKWLRNRYRRAALLELDQIAREQADDFRLLAAVSALLKATALQVYPRTEVASLSGACWPRWLNETSPGASFSAGSVTMLSGSVYRPAQALPRGELEKLIGEAAAWIRHHREPQRA